MGRNSSRMRGGAGPGCNGPCNACGNADLLAFHEVRSIPAQSTVLVRSANEARSLPKGDLRLCFCKACGFIQNDAFDPAICQDSSLSETSQGASPRFNRYLREMTRRLVDTYEIRGKTVLEIGCAGGEWLDVVCSLGRNSGIGIDPTPSVGTAATGTAARFIRDFYGVAHADLAPDVIACRHTLEHIQPARKFLEMVRGCVGDRIDTLIFFEVPDVARILTDAAFWDVYYDHCSYFSLGSLVRLFRACDFEALDAWRGFDDQYLLLTARACGTTMPRRLQGEDDVEDLRRSLEHFSSTYEDLRGRWGAALARFRRDGKRVVVWGSSSKGVAFLTTLGTMDEVGFVVDINPARQGWFMPGSGHEIVSPERMVEYRPDVVIVMNPIYTREIRDQLESLGVENVELIPV